MLFCAVPAVDAAGRRLQASDTIQIRVLNQPEFDSQARISPDGTVSLPYLGRIRAAGLTEDQLATRYRNILQEKELVKDAQVIVSTSGYGAQLTVLGAVRTPGEQVLDRPTTLSEALSRAGGPLQPAGTIILRRGGKVYRYDQATVLAGRGPKANPFVGNGDQIYVEEAPVFYLYGYVNRPGVYPLVRPLTVQQALASGGGLAELGSEWRIDIKRIREGRVEVTPADLDQRVLPNDTIVVKERIF
jgi:polysaccharide export outer membrane protein